MNRTDQLFFLQLCSWERGEILHVKLCYRYFRPFKELRNTSKFWNKYNPRLCSWTLSAPIWGEKRTKFLANFTVLAKKFSKHGNLFFFNIYSTHLLICLSIPQTVHCRHLPLPFPFDLVKGRPGCQGRKSLSLWTRQASKKRILPQFLDLVSMLRKYFFSRREWKRRKTGNL